MIQDIKKIRERKVITDKEITTIQNSTEIDFEKLKDLIDESAHLGIELQAENKRANRLLAESNLGKRFENRTFENFDGNLFPGAYTKAVDYATRFEDNMGQGLLFTGNPGTGKTHLAAAITNYIITQLHIPVKFIGFSDLLEEAKQNFGKCEDIIAKLNKVPLLVIDDLGKERTSEWSNSVLYRIVNMRYEHLLPIIFTTNETITKLEDMIGEATVSRILEICDGAEMVGADYRKQKLRR